MWHLLLVIVASSGAQHYYDELRALDICTYDEPVVMPWRPLPNVTVFFSNEHAPASTLTRRARASRTDSDVVVWADCASRHIGVARSDTPLYTDCMQIQLRSARNHLSQPPHTPDTDYFLTEVSYLMAQHTFFDTTCTNPWHALSIAWLGPLVSTIVVTLGTYVVYSCCGHARVAR